EVDDHFLSDARDRDTAVAGAGPGLADANPAARMLVALTLAIPVELDLYAAVLVGVNLFALRADDRRGLAAAHVGPGRHARCAERHGRRDALEVAAVDRRVVAVMRGPAGRNHGLEARATVLQRIAAQACRQRSGIAGDLTAV